MDARHVAMRMLILLTSIYTHDSALPLISYTDSAGVVVFFFLPASCVIAFTQICEEKVKRLRGSVDLLYLTVGANRQHGRVFVSNIHNWLQMKKEI